jgi:D-lactate dehydrogenase
MKIAFFDARSYERKVFTEQNAVHKHDITFMDARLTEKTVGAAAGHDCICAFVNDTLDEPCLKSFAQMGGRLVALRSAGFNHMDLEAAAMLGLSVVRVPEYSAHAVAEHAVALILSLNRKIHRAYARVREGNFSIEGLTGFDVFGKTVGVIGMGKIGRVFAQIMLGFGCNVIAHDLTPSPRQGVAYVPLADLYAQSDIISLHMPLTKTTRHLINAEALKQMKKNVMLINTGRGGLIDTPALICALKEQTIGSAGLDVYEEEEGVFFTDHSGDIVQDDKLARLMTFPNVLITAHQAFLTQEALHNIAATTLQNISDFEAKRPLINEVRADKKAP